MPHSIAAATAPAVTGPVLTLNNGVTMPSLGFGTFASQGSKGETHRAVVCALNAGYRHLDCAALYDHHNSTTIARTPW